MNRRQIDWLGFIVRFICGAILGLLIGLGWWAYGDPNDHALPYFIAGALVIGLISAIKGDDFWENINHWWI